MAPSSAPAFVNRRLQETLVEHAPRDARDRMRRAHPRWPDRDAAIGELEDERAIGPLDLTHERSTRGAIGRETDQMRIAFRAAWRAARARRFAFSTSAM